MNKIMLLTLSLGLAISAAQAAQAAQAAVVADEVSYRANGKTMKGFFAYDNTIKGKRPGVLVVHEWWGLNDYVRKRAVMLAEQGYAALALDMYGAGKHTDHPDAAGKFVAGLNKNMPVAKARFEAAMKLLRKQKNVDPQEIAAIGYCFGGGVVLNMARQGENLKGVASFHGPLGTSIPAQPGKVKARIISFTGEADPIIGADKVAAFRQEMENAGVNYRVITYPGAKHSFTNPEADELGRRYNLPHAYNAAADKDSWQQLTVFLREIFARE